MSATGWMGEAPDGGRALPVASMLLAQRERGPGDALEMAAARSRAADVRQALDEAAGARDPDEVAAAMINRGYTPGAMADLSQRLMDTVAEAAAEREKIERSERRQARINRDHQAGRITVADIMAMPDADEGDARRAEQLELRANRLREQIAETAAAIAPQHERAPDPMQAAASRAHAAFVEATRAKMADAQAGRVPELPPFGSAGPGADAEPNPGPVWNQHPAVVPPAERQSLWNAGQEIRRGNLGAAVAVRQDSSYGGVGWSGGPDIARSSGAWQEPQACAHCRNMKITRAQSAQIHANAERDGVRL